ASADIFDAALAAARAGRQREALEMLTGELARERSGRGRFQRRMQLAHLLIAGGQPAIAYPILHDLSQEIEKRKLEEWETGDVLPYPLSLLLDCMKNLSEEDEAQKQLYARICRLDPLRALNHSG